MATVKELKATARPQSGKGAARAERRAGRVPGVIYGNNQPPSPSRSTIAELRQRILAGRFLTTIYDIDLEGKKHRVIPRDFHLDPVRDFPIHVDFMRLGEGATIRVSVPCMCMNAETAPGVKRGGTVNIVTHTIDLECSVDNIPQYIEADVSAPGNQPLAASVRHQAAGRREVAVARRRDAGDHRAAVRLRRRAEGGCGRLLLPVLPAAAAAAPRLRRLRRRVLLRCLRRVLQLRRRARRRRPVAATRRSKPDAGCRVMRLFVGLGNPGAKYANNRHNIGFMVVDEIARRHGFAPWRRRFQGETSEGTLDRERVVLLKPTTFMNESGRAVQEAANFFKLGGRRDHRVPGRTRTAAGEGARQGRRRHCRP